MSKEKSWAQDLLEDESEEENEVELVACQSCGTMTDSLLLKPLKKDGMTLFACQSCIDAEKARKAQEKKESTKKELGAVLEKFSDVLAKLDVIGSSMLTREDVKNILSMKDEIITTIGTKQDHRTDVSVSIPPVDDVIPTARAMLLELSSSTVGYISHYDTFKSRWGKHHDAEIKAELAKLWMNGILLRDAKHRFILDPSATFEQVNRIAQNDITLASFSQMQQAAKDKMNAAATKFVSFSSVDNGKKKMNVIAGDE